MTVKLAKPKRVQSGKDINDKTVAAFSIILTFAFGIGNIRHQLFGDLATQAHLGERKGQS